MPKTFTIKDARGSNLGEIVFSKGKFMVNIPAGAEKEKLEKLLDSFVKKGIRDLGEITLEKPIKAGDTLFFSEVKNQLARRGYILTEKEK